MQNEDDCQDTVHEEDISVEGEDIDDNKARCSTKEADYENDEQQWGSSISSLESCRARDAAHIFTRSYEQIDPKLWEMETERVAPKLKMLAVNQARNGVSIVSLHNNMVPWQSHIDVVSAFLQKRSLPASALKGGESNNRQDIQIDISSLQKYIANDLESIRKSERIMNAAASVQSYSAEFADYQKVSCLCLCLWLLVSVVVSSFLILFAHSNSARSR